LTVIKHKNLETMKKIIHILPLLFLIAAACEREREPFADFIVSSRQVGVFETVYFTNTSSGNADYFEWDFGDGTWSDALNASHFYEEAGIYQVSLKAYSGSRMVDQVTTEIEVLTTALTVIVEEYSEHYRVPDASVILYPTLEDWDFETNSVVEGTTDHNGEVRFVNLNPVIYYADVWHPNHNNYLLADDDVSWITTDPLVIYGENEFVAYVDRVGTVTRKDGKNVDQYRILKIERRTKNMTK